MVATASRDRLASPHRRDVWGTAVDNDLMPEYSGVATGIG